MKSSGLIVSTGLQPASTGCNKLGTKQPYTEVEESTEGQEWCTHTPQLPLSTNLSSPY
jgi:hypothetical protein